MLLGGLIVAAFWNFYAKQFSGAKDAGHYLAGAADLTGRLPVVMTYVINLAVPPLLFAQVLYGQALYTSSVLIGAWWFSIIFLLMVCYSLLYVASSRSYRGHSTWIFSLIAWLFALTIAKILSSNMTLMLRPEAWGDMYAASALGVHLPKGDPTLIPRWVFMMFGGFTFAGIGLMLLSIGKAHDENMRGFMAKSGGSFAMLGAGMQGMAGYGVFVSQPAVVQKMLVDSQLYSAVGLVWFLALGLVGVAGALQLFKPIVGKALPIIASASGAIFIFATVIYRDGIRDLTLLSKGFDVWKRVEVSNWYIISAFLVLFVLALVAMGWLISIMAKAQPAKKEALT